MHCSHVVKRNLMQNVVPTMAALKHVLERACSPLLGALMASLAQILKDYRTEIDDMLASNRQVPTQIIDSTEISRGSDGQHQFLGVGN